MEFLVMVVLAVGEGLEGRWAWGGGLGIGLGRDWGGIGF